ncbi:AraC family transcriptional regulator [Pendulispora rubella]|uniref:AraC family transcriptional regulator n=1 Tax=Pendulispora rubella TaxID=2741070 RepID=A0ABZ2L037_9BACT
MVPSPELARFSMPVAYLRQVAAQVEALGLDVGVWLMRSGLTAAALDDLELEDLPFDLFRRLIVDAIALSEEPALGLLVGQRLQVQTHGVLGYAAQSSGSLRQALGLFESFTRTRISLVDIEADGRRDETRVRLVERRDLGDVRRPVLEAVNMAAKNILDAISMGTAAIHLVSFPFEAPSYASFAERLFGCRTRYGGAWAGFTIPNRVLDVPLRAADPLAFREAVRTCERELERLATTETFAGRVRRVLLEHQNGFPSLEVTARILHVTPRTMHRRLLDEGTSFREILEDLRHQLAKEHMKAGRFTLQEIAYRLGYTDFANFRRAFKRWEGVAPTVYCTSLRTRKRG